MIGLVSTFIIMAYSIYLIVEGNEKNDSTKFYGGIIATILSIFLMCLVIQIQKIWERYINSRDLTK